MVKRLITDEQQERFLPDCAGFVEKINADGMGYALRVVYEQNLRMIKSDPEAAFLEYTDEIYRLHDILGSARKVLNGRGPDLPEQAVMVEQSEYDRLRACARIILDEWDL